MASKPRSEAAFESLYSRHARDVYGYALAMLGEPADAEDVTQTTFLNAYRAYARGERPSKPRGWLFTIAHNVCRQRWRQAARRPREVEELEDRFPAAEETDAPSAQDIARALQSLPFNQRSALVMRELEGRRQDEIAAALGVSVSAVETLLFRARRGVREQLESSLSCGEAARAISRQLDGGSSRGERAALRAHLRECESCATFARRARAQQGALRRLRALPLPASLLGWGATAGGSATVAGVGAGGGGVAVKLLAGTAAVALFAGAGAGDAPVAHHHAPAAAHAATSPPRRHTPASAAAAAAAAHPVAHVLPATASAPPPKPITVHTPTARPPRTHHGRTKPPSAGHGHAYGHTKVKPAHANPPARFKPKPPKHQVKIKTKLFKAKARPPAKVKIHVKNPKATANHGHAHDQGQGQGKGKNK